MKSITLVFSFFLLSCHSQTRTEAEKNTVFSTELEDGEYLKKIKSLEIGMPTKDAITIIGNPIWIKNLGDGTITENKQEIENHSFKGGKFRMSYTYQKNAALDFIRISLLSEDERVIEIENVWYRE